MIWLIKTRRPAQPHCHFLRVIIPGRQCSDMAQTIPIALEMACAFHNLVRECLVEDGLASYM